jgi:hypothetical protein
MARIPDKYSLSAQPSLRSGRVIATYDTTAIGEGVQRFASGLASMGDAFQRKAEEERQQANAVDLARSEAEFTKGLLNVENTYQNDPDYATLNKRGNDDIDKQLSAAGNLIRDPKMRERWLATKQEAAVRAKDWLTDKATAKQREASVVAVDEANRTLYDIVIDPDTPDDVREKARADIGAAIDVNEKTGLLSPEEAAKRRELFVNNSYDQQALLAVERGKLVLPSPNNPLYQDDLDVDPLTRAMIRVESQGDPTAESDKGASGLMQVMPRTAAEIAREIGDADFPATEAEQKEYLKNPAVSVRYGKYYMKKMLEKYDGDQDAALIAYNGGSERADKWLAAGRDDSVLPAETREYYKKVKGGMTDGKEMPIVLTRRRDPANIEKVDPVVIDRFKQVQNALGISIPINSGHRDPGHNKRVGGANRSQHIEGKAIDLDVSNMSKAERLRVIKTASALGFTGIGVYENSLHLDMGGRRAWGPSYRKESVPEWARDAINAHMQAKDLPGYWDKVSPGMREKLYQTSAAQKEALSKQRIAETKILQQQAKDDFSLQIAVSPNKVSQSDILANPVLDNGDKASLIEKLNSARKENEGVNEFISALGGGDSVPINPFDSDQKKIADKAFDQMLGATPEENRALLASSFISQTGYIPEKVRSEIRRNMATTDVETMATSLQTVDAIQKIAPTSLLAMEGHEQVNKNLSAFRHYAFDLGYSTEEAARKVVSLNDPAMAAQREAIMKSKPIADAIKSVDASAVADLFDSAFSAQPDLGDAPTQQELSVGYTPESEAVILAEYKSMLEEGIADAGGDLELGKKMADDRFKRLYGPSPLTLAGDGAIVKLPPEKAYPADQNGSHDYIRQQALDDLKAEGINASEVYLQAYEQTERDVAAGRLANYQVFYVQDGKLQKLPNPFIADPALANKTAVETARQKQKESLTKTIETQERLKAAGKRKEGSEDWIRAQEIQNEYQRLEHERRTGAAPVEQEQEVETPAITPKQEPVIDEEADLIEAIRKAREAAAEEFKDYPETYRMQKMREAERAVRDAQME